MFSFFGGGYGSRYSSYGHDQSSDSEDEKSSAFQLSHGSEGGSTNEALEAALAQVDPNGGKIELETEDGDEQMDIDAAVAASQKLLCIECIDQPATVTCVQCQDNYCEVCFSALHKRGTRATHTHTPFTLGQQLNATVNAHPATKAAASASSASPAEEEKGVEPMDESVGNTTTAVPTPAPTTAGSSSSATKSKRDEEDVFDDEFEDAYQRQRKTAKTSSAPSPAAAAANQRSSTSALSDEELSEDEDEDEDGRSVRSGASTTSSRSTTSRAVLLPNNAMNSSLLTGLSGRLPENWFQDRAKYIPLRLTLEERKFLRLLEATLNVSEYTDKIDIVSNKDKLQRIKEQLRDLCSILSGLIVANDYKLGQKLLKDKEFADNADFFRNIFELGRRHKIRNPEKMRSSYGKLVFIIQDSVNPTVEELMGFHLYAPLKTVFSKLEACGAGECLLDELMMTATGDIKTEGRQRPEIERDIKRKEAAVTYLARKYQNAQIDEEGMRACILSIADNHTFLIQNRHCCDTMLQWLTESYHPTEPRNPYSLAILGGRAGARLTHSHANQYSYVLQSLTLWREVLHDMFRLWCHTEEDLFDSTNPYRLRNTGQGLNRVQSAPRVGKSMHNILYHCQRKLGGWVGSSVIHLGDHNVPNAFMFIDKYNQVSRILNPIVLTIKALPRLMEKKDIKFYIDSIFGGPEKLKLLILTDFFRHGFDGSGADNFFDAGSCIDGRLTSAWNWCSKLEKKSFYPIFQLAGFSSFDGQWSD